MKTSELSGQALAFAVAKCEGWVWTYVKEVDILGCRYRYIKTDAAGYSIRDRYELGYSSWERCGPIIERERIAVDWVGEEWSATIVKLKGAALMPCGYSYGPTPLVAAMRCLVCAKLGDTIDIPEELCQQPKT